MVTALLVDLWSFEDSSFDSVWLEVDIEVPLLDFLGVRYHLVQLLDASDSLVRLLEQALPDVSHDTLVLSDLGWNTHKGTELRWQVNVLSLLSNLKQRLTNRVYFDTVSSQEVVDHVGPGFLIAVIKDVVSWVHVPLDLVDLVGSVRSVLGHHNGSFEFSIDEILIVALKSVIY